MNGRQVFTDRTPQALLSAGWYGKLPGAGDFVHRGLAHGVVRRWEQWMQAGLQAMSEQAHDSLARDYAVAPVWNFALPAGEGSGLVQLGTLAPSCDRVGRYFPLMALCSAPAEGFDPAVLARSAGFYAELGQCLLQAIRHSQTAEHFQAGVQSAAGQWLPGRGGAVPLRGWADLPDFFDPFGATGYWWTNQADGSPLVSHAHTGRLNSSLFLRLFGSQGGLR